MKSISVAVMLVLSVLWGTHQLNAAGGSKKVSTGGNRGCGDAFIMYGNCDCNCCYNSFVNGDAVTVNCAQANNNNGTLNVLGVLVPITSNQCSGGCSSGTQCALVLLNVGDPTGDVPTAKQECCTSQNGTNVLNCPSDNQCNEQRYEYDDDGSTNFCCSHDRSNCPTNNNN